MFRKIITVCFMLVFSACTTTNPSFFGMRLKSEVVKQPTHNVECALVEGFLTEGRENDTVCVCALSLERLRAISSVKVRAFVHSVDALCSGELDSTTENNTDLRL